MSKICAICNKNSVLITPRNKLRGKYNPVEKIRKYPNLQWVRLPAGKAGLNSERVRACAKCIKNLARTGV